MRGLAGAVTLLTRAPWPRSGEGAPLSAAVPWFPVVGGAIGLFGAGVYAAALVAVPPLVAAALSVTGQVVATGALHEDGLADVADSLDGRDPGERRAILKDPHHGTYGVLALVAVFTARVAAVAGLGAGQALAALPAVHALGRSAAVAVMASTPVAASGLGADYARYLRRRQATVGVVAGPVLAVALVGWWAAVPITGAAALALAGSRLTRRAFGGVTGDALGATEQCTEVMVLVVAAALVAAGHPLPWWR